MPAPDLIALSMSSARALRVLDSEGSRHCFIYCESDCIAYRKTLSGRIIESMRLGSTVEVWRLAFHEFGCMDWPVVSPVEFDRRLPNFKVTA